MKKSIFSGILLLSVLAGCIYDEGPDCENETAGGTYLAVRSSSITFPTANGEPESITLNTLRIIVFSRATGRVVTNKVFDISDHTPPSADNEWVVDFSDIVVETKPGESIVYVILNEDVSAVSGKSLAGELNKLSTLADMNTLVNTPLSYATPLRVEYESDGVTPKEPPFVMSTFGECVIPEGRTAADPYLADLRGPSEGQSGFELDRTMAKVTIESVSNRPMYEGQTIDNVATSYIFILKMGLVNVPMHYLWSPNRPQTDGYPVPAYTGSYQMLDFGLENSEKGYYDRTWYGNLALSLTAEAFEINALKDSVVWYSGKAEGKKSYTLNKTDLDTFIYTYSGTYTNEPWYDKYNGGTPTILELNAGNFFKFMEAQFQSASPGDFLPVSYDYFNENIIPNMTGGDWSLDIKDISYYVPEHILADKTSPANATKLYVKASMASAPDTISEEMGNQVTWNPTTWGDWVYALKPGGTENITKAEANAIWGFERDTVPHLKKDGQIEYIPIIRHYWKAGIRYRDGNRTGYLDHAEFAYITDSQDIHEFYLPICNGPAETVDYNIYRNHEYRFSVHVIEAWGQALSSGSTGRAAKLGNIVIQMK